MRLLFSLLQDLRENFRIVDAVDILVISVLVYAVLWWIRDTASRGVVLGISVLTALYFLARTFDMYLTSLVFHTAFAVLLIVLVVVFQEEIRRSFERVASWGTLRQLRAGTTVLAEEIDAMVEATFVLAVKKYGALIVVAGREPLARHLNGGVELAGRITKPILYSIFDPSSDGHDGAVIVERDRIESFGVHLPISKNQRQIRGRGTRHSAALGLSECCDALTIVVSEERGEVSIAEKGRLRAVSTATDLKARLSSFLEDRFPRNLETTWNRFVRHDVRFKLLALSLAVVAWFALAFNVERIQTSVVVPIEYRNLPENFLIDEPEKAEALVTLSGSERAFRLLDRRILKISLDLAHVKASSDPIPPIAISHSALKLPPNLRVDRVHPEEVHVRFKPPALPTNANPGPPELKGPG